MNNKRGTEEETGHLKRVRKHGWKQPVSSEFFLFSNLLQELQLHVCSFLDEGCLASFCLSCNSFRALMDEPSSPWKQRVVGAEAMNTYIENRKTFGWSNRIVSLRIMKTDLILSIEELLSHAPSCLISLDFSSCSGLTDESFHRLPNSLRELNLADTGVTCAVFRHLPRSLRSLNLSNTSIAKNEKDDEQEWSNLPSALTWLNLRNTYVNDKIISVLPKSLTHLDISVLVMPNVTDRGLCFLPTTLKSLVYSTKSFDEHVALSRLTHLDSLEIGYFMHGTDERFAFLPRSLKSLRISTFSDRLTKQGLAALPSFLTELHISNTSIANDEEFSNFPFPTTLRALKMTYIDVDNDDLMPIFNSFPKSLISLDLSLTSATTEDFASFLPFLTSLTSLTLYNATAVSNKVLEVLPPSLTYLDVRNTVVTYSDAERLIKRSPKLKLLYGTKSPILRI